MTTARTRRDRDGRRGTSLIETLVAVTILALMMIGILQMFSLSLVVSAGSAARTTMSFKAQQVAEIIRIHVGLVRAAGTGLVGSGLPTTLTPVGGADLPYGGVDVSMSSIGGTTATWDFWGPTQFGVFEDAKGPYKIRLDYSATTEGTIVTIRVTPTDATDATRRFFTFQSSEGGSTGIKLGRLGNMKVDYVARVN